MPPAPVSTIDESEEDPAAVKTHSTREEFAAEGKMRDIIDRINADSDDDHIADDPPDFGDDEEEDTAPPEPAPALAPPTPPLEPSVDGEYAPPPDPPAHGRSIVQIETIDNDAALEIADSDEGSIQQEREPVHGSPAKGRAAKPAASSKAGAARQKLASTAKKDGAASNARAVKKVAAESRKDGVAKTIKKGSTDLKMPRTSNIKPKAINNRGPLKSFPVPPKKKELKILVESMKPDKSVAGKASKTASVKSGGSSTQKAAAKAAAKAASQNLHKSGSKSKSGSKAKKVGTRSPGKASGTPTKGAAEAKVKRVSGSSRSSGSPSNDGKPKKTIVKENSQGVKKVALKKHSGEKGAATKSLSKKGSPGAKGKSGDAKPRTPKKGRRLSKERYVEDSDVEGEQDVEMGTVEDDDTPQNESSEDEVDFSRLTYTPNSKGSIIGHIACSTRDENTVSLLRHAVQMLGRYNIVSYGPDSKEELNAYVIGKGTTRGWGVLQAVARGVPLVSEDWLTASISSGKWEQIRLYCCDRFGQSPRSVVGRWGGNKLLDGYRFSVSCVGGDASCVKKLIQICGGREAETRVDIIINDTGSPVGEVANVTKKWLADSIEAGMPIATEPYLLNG